MGNLGNLVSYSITSLAKQLIYKLIYHSGKCHLIGGLEQRLAWVKLKPTQLSGSARGGSGIPIYPLFCPQDTNIPQNRKMCDTKYLKLFWNRILNIWKWTEFKSVDQPAWLLQFANRLVLKPLYFSSYLSVF